MSKETELLSVHDALSRLLAAATKRAVLASQQVPLLSANGMIVASDVIAPINVPNADNAAMDGYALNTSDLDAHPLRISQRIAAGQAGQALQANTAARIFTGAPIPPGANAVVMQEQCEVQEGGCVRFLHHPQPGECIRRIGEDVKEGDVILKVGTHLQAQELGLAASVGLETLPVKCPLKVAVLVTGDELVMPGHPLKKGAVYNSNRFLIITLLKNLGCDVIDLGIIPDTLAATRNALKSAATQCDVIVTSGGVSVGEEDHVKAALQAEGHLDLWKIAMKPGKPLAFGAIDSTFFIGLPGNPVSAFVTLLMFVRPFLLRMQGVQNVDPKSYFLRADFTWPKPQARTEFLRVKLNNDGGLDLYPNQNSAVLSSLVWGDGLVKNPPNVAIQTGDRVPFIPFSEVL